MHPAYVAVIPSVKLVNALTTTKRNTMKLIGYFRHLFYSLRMEEIREARIFHIESIIKTKQTVTIPYSYDTTVRMNIPEKYGFQMDVHKTLIIVYQKKVYEETGVLFPLDFFDSQVTKRILKLHYEGRVNASLP